MSARANAFDDECAYNPGKPPGYRGGSLRLGAAADGNALAVKVFELPPGEAICPYHYEYEEEWLIVLSGTVTLRTPGGEEQLERGAIVAFPAGPQGAHKVTNTGSETARAMMFSGTRRPVMAVYPDSDKIGVWPGNPDDEVILHRRDGAVDYFDGETG